MLIVLARRIEITLRLDFLWRAQSIDEKEQMSVLEDVNAMLLQNMLPRHVATHYTNLMQMGAVSDSELYSEQYNNVAVMFASIPNFAEFYSEEVVNHEGIECLRLLNEIIIDFDEVAAHQQNNSHFLVLTSCCNQILLRPKFSAVEKIKTIGSTYMAAAGLSPRKEDEGSNWHCLCVLVEFAFQLQNRLEQSNSHSFQTFSLRVGMDQMLLLLDYTLYL
jgi:hypothetical protein